MTEAIAVQRLQQILQLYASVRPNHVRAAVPTLGRGKPYEIFCFAHMLERLALSEGLHYQFVHQGGLQFRQKGGPRSHAFAHINAFQNGAYFGTIWTDVVFAGLSAHAHVCQQKQLLAFGQVHELDICLVSNNAQGIVCHEEIRVGVECKDRAFNSALLKQVLGVRREMTFVQNGNPQGTGLQDQALSFVQSFPPSWLLVNASTSVVLRYATPGDFFGIRFEYV